MEHVSPAVVAHGTEAVHVPDMHARLDQGILGVRLKEQPPGVRVEPGGVDVRLAQLGAVCDFELAE